MDENNQHSNKPLFIENLILNNFPTLKHKFTINTYFYIGLVFFLLNYFLYKYNHSILILFIGLIIYGYILLKENNRLLVEETADFQNLEEKMEVLLNKDMLKGISAKKNYLYVDLNLLDFLYNIRAFRRKSLKYFNDTIRNVNSFLEVVEYIKDHNKATSENLQKLSELRKQALNSFHSIVFRITSLVEIQKHNEVRYLLDEKLNNIFLECLEYGKNHINLNNFAYDTYYDKNYDIY